MNILAKLPRRSPRGRRRRRLRSLAVAPTLLTLGNLLCGFAAIHFALRAMFELGAGGADLQFPNLPASRSAFIPPSLLSIGACLVMVGMVFDLLDGLVARVTRSTTNFGGQLDSLADVVSFGVAPATLMVAFMTRELAADSILPSPISPNFLGRCAWVCAAVYVAFTAIRLARFNVEHSKADFDYKTFRGLPTPAAGGTIAALILFQDQVGALAGALVVSAIPFVALTVAFLMVSRIPYRRVDRTYLFGRRPFGQFVFAMFVLACFFTFKAPTLLLIAGWYVMSDPIRFMGRRLRERRSGSTLAETSGTAPDDGEVATKTTAEANLSVSIDASEKQKRA